MITRNTIQTAKDTIESLFHILDERETISGELDSVRQVFHQPDTGSPTDVEVIRGLLRERNQIIKILKKNFKISEDDVWYMIYGNTFIPTVSTFLKKGRKKTKKK